MYREEAEREFCFFPLILDIYGCFTNIFAAFTFFKGFFGCFYRGICYLCTGFCLLEYENNTEFV